MLSPLAKGLFNRGICESFCPSGNFPTLQTAETRAQPLRKQRAAAAARARALPHVCARCRQQRLNSWLVPHPPQALMLSARWSTAQLSQHNRFRRLRQGNSIMSP